MKTIKKRLILFKDKARIFFFYNKANITLVRS